MAKTLYKVCLRLLVDRRVGSEDGRGQDVHI